MISQAINLIATELNTYLNSVGPLGGPNDDEVTVGNIAMLESNGQQNNNLNNRVVLTLVRIEEETTLKNIPTYRKNYATNKTEYKNPPVHLNLYLLFSVNNSNYNNALTYLSRIVRYFQYKNVFTQKNSAAPTSINPVDQLSDYKLILDLFSPSFEECNNIWGTLGGKQLPHVMYKARMLELELDLMSDGREAIQEIQINDPLSV